MNMATPTPGKQVTVIKLALAFFKVLLCSKLNFAFLLCPGHLMSMTPEQLQAWRWEREIDERNRPLTDEELDAMFPEGYKVHAPFQSY